MKNAPRMRWLDKLLGLTVPSLAPGEVIGRPDGWTPAGEADHFMDCPVCGQNFDMRDLGQALEHWHEGPLDGRLQATEEDLATIISRWLRGPKAALPP
jgi:hypothetical protein